ncbi:MAG: PAS domain-containing protein [Sulfurospirillum sp.]|nr:PAS domain-containing protein [Sulfurospirillum sp.]
MLQRLLSSSLILCVIIFFALGSLLGSIYFYQNRVDVSFAKTASIQKSMRLFYEAEVDFRIQVQEWKDILLRASNEKLRDKHYLAFLQASQNFKQKLIQIEYLLQSLYDQHDQAFEKLATLQELYEQLNAQYFVALELLKSSDLKNIQEIDTELMGHDRIVSKAMGELRDIVLNRFDSVRQQIRAQLQDFSLVASFVLLFVVLFTASMLLIIRKHKQSQDIFKHTLDYINQGVMLLESEKVVFASQKYKEIIGKDLMGLRMEDLYEFIYPKDVKSIKKAHLIAFKEKKSLLHYIYRVQKQDGSLIWVEDDVQITYNNNGKTNRVYIIARDITESVQKQEELEQSKRKYRALLKLSSDILFLKDANLRYFVVNEKFRDFIGKDEVDILDKTDYDIMDFSIAKVLEEGDRYAWNNALQTISTLQIYDKIFEITRYKIQFSKKTYLAGIIKEII